MSKPSIENVISYWAEGNWQVAVALEVTVVRNKATAVKILEFTTASPLDRLSFKEGYARAEYAIVPKSEIFHTTASHYWPCAETIEASCTAIEAGLELQDAIHKEFIIPHEFQGWERIEAMIRNDLKKRETPPHLIVLGNALSKIPKIDWWRRLEPSLRSVAEDLASVEDDLEKLRNSLSWIPSAY